ncbi:ComF family protein [Shewanella phaeophyticola]|uniref:Phosphoribosyltransferase family protein n=1 Tax=Shewanella phaeophyticola TaxID=2978345 RepID=A0ABT2P1N5_9GAMM|nr:phosphoribosyltransferase family protein [Shewanella sp. KJ10-1]MCT8986553.1 phosphoribosyltransferase family protein [Shewanella sp. KJ10-1]
MKVSTTNAKNTVINLPDNAKKAREFDKIINLLNGAGAVKKEIRSNNATNHMLNFSTKSNAASIDNSNSQNKFAARFDTPNETRESLKKKHKEDIKAKFRKDVNDQSEPHAYFISSKSPCVNVSLIDEKHHNNNNLLRAEFASNLDGKKLTLEHDINNNYDPLAILVMDNGKYIGHIYKVDNEEEIDKFCFEHGQLKTELCIVKVNKGFVLQQKIMAINIQGNWKAGWALHLHTAKSVMLGNGSFENTYTATGHALNRLKYHNETQYISQLVNELVAFIQTRNVTQDLSAIVPAPASKVRRLQPVYVVAEQVANRLGIIYDPTYIEKVKNTDQLKSIESPQKRSNLLQGAFNVDQRYRNKKVLIIDDLFRSGSTLKELTRTMYNKGSVNDVYVVTLTKTRVHR